MNTNTADFWTMNDRHNKTQGEITMKENIIKGVLTAAMATLMAYLGHLVIPIIVLAGVMLLDYGTGIAKAWVKGELSSKIGIIGILKKLGYLVVVAVGMIIDWIIQAGMTELHIDFKLEFLFAMIVIIWLILNELISILENVAAIGAPVPKWLTKIITKLKDQTEAKVSADEVKEE